MLISIFPYTDPMSKTNQSINPTRGLGARTNATVGWKIPVFVGLSSGVLS